MNQLIGAVGNGTLRGVLTPQSNHRKLVHMRGVDSFKLLQSLCTKKILTVVEADDAGEFCDYAAFLHNKGRVLTEALLMYRPTSKSWFIDVPSTSLQPLLEHIQQYKMRNRITIDVDEVNATYKTWTIVASTEANMKELSLWILNKTSQLELMFYQDPRFPLALRLIAPSYLNPLSVLPPLGDIYEEDIDSKQTLYDYLRNLSGVAEGPSQIVPLSSIPFECNFDLTNGIDYDKGCYIGQELVARTHFRGAVRKRLFPLVSLGTAQSLAGRTKSTASQLLSSIWNNDLQTNEITAVPQGILRPIPGVAAQTSAASSQSKLGPASSSGASKKVRVNVELDPTYDIANHFPPEGTALIPITNETDLESILSGKTLAFKGGAASMSRVSKTIGGSSWNAGMGMLRVDALESSPAMLFYAPSTSDTSTGSLLKVVKPWWYSNYQHWRLEAESKAEAQQAEDL